MDLEKLEIILRKNLSFECWTTNERLNILNEYCCCLKLQKKIPFFIQRTSFSGRLGNQMFDIAAFLQYSKDIQSKHPNVIVHLLLPNEGTVYQFPNVVNNDFILQHCESFFFLMKQFNYCHTLDENILGENEYLLLTGDHKPLPSFDPNHFGYCIDGCFFSYLYFQTIRDDLLSLFSIPQNYNVQDNVSIHIRRTDYLNNIGKAWYVLPITYYEQAVKMFDKETQFLVFSDDIEWCKNQFQKNDLLSQYNLQYVDESIPDFEALIMMSQCKHNIIANSTFSWWAAYLNQNKNKKVICPNEWFNKNVDCFDLRKHEEDQWRFAHKLIMKDWIRINKDISSIDLPEKWRDLLRSYSQKHQNNPILQNIPEYSEKVAYIIEPRKNTILLDILINYITLLAPEGWAFHIFHGNLNQEMLEDFSQKVNKIHLHNLNVDNLSLLEYNQLGLSYEFYEKLPGTHLLHFETDTLLTSGKLDKYMQYDYIGAPFPDNNDPCKIEYYKNHGRVGNSGFSLFKKQEIIRVIKDKYQNQPVAMDIFLADQDLKFPSVDIAKTFSVESIYYKNPIGYHKPWPSFPENGETFHKICSNISSQLGVEIKISIIGCGFVSYYYLCNHYSDIKIVGVYDRNDSKSTRLSQYYKCKKYLTFEEMLSDDSVDMILNLTNPKSHYEISMKILQAKKHLFTEKPVALSLEHFDDLIQEANNNNVELIAAPANYLTNYCDALKNILSELGNIQKVVGMITERDVPYHQIVNPLQQDWNINDEFRVGCNLEHAGYLLSLLTTLFGNAKHISTQKKLSSIQKIYGDKRYHIDTPDYYRSELLIGGISCIMVNSITSTDDKSFTDDKSVTFYGDNGKVVLENIWDYNSNIFLNDKLISYPTDHFKQEWILNMDLMRPVHYFNNPDKKEKLMKYDQLRNILDIMLTIQED